MVPPDGVTPFSSLRAQNTISQNLIMSNRITVHPAEVSGIALYGVDDSVPHLLDNAYMVRLSVLGAGAALVVPVEEDNHAGSRLGGTVQPLPTLLKPLHAVSATGKFRADTRVDIAALVCTPADKTGTPLHTATESVPRPIRFAAYISDLRQRYRNDGIVPGIDAVENG